MDTLLRGTDVDFSKLENWAKEIEQNPEAFLFHHGFSDYPPVRIFIIKDKLIITAEAPGMEAQDFNVLVLENNIRISGTKSAPYKNNQCFYCVERPMGQFNRLIYIPTNIDRERVEAVYKNGLLTITMPILD